MYADQNVNYPYYSPILAEFGSLLKIFIKAPSIKFQGNPSIISHHGTCGQPGKQKSRKIHIMKSIIGAFGN
jgi:hypothetical protein